MKGKISISAFTLAAFVLFILFQSPPTEAEATCKIKLVFEYEVENLAVEFKDLSKGSYDKLWWDFGDGKVSEEENPKHLYEKEGIYTFCLKASCSQKGYTKDFCGQVYLFNMDY